MKKELTCIKPAIMADEHPNNAVSIISVGADDTYEATSPSCDPGNKVRKTSIHLDIVHPDKIKQKYNNGRVVARKTSETGKVEKRPITQSRTRKVEKRQVPQNRVRTNVNRKIPRTRKIRNRSESQLDNIRPKRRDETVAQNPEMKSSTRSPKKVAVLGAAGGIGQPLSLLCKLSNHIDELSCYDIAGTPGLVADLSHIPTRTKITGSVPSPVSLASRINDGLTEALAGADVVVIPAGLPRRPGMTRDDLFKTNASIVKTLVEGCAEICPEAVLAIISNPVNSTVPVAAEVLKKAGVYDKRKLCGVTMLDVCRANTFAAVSQDGWNPKNLNVTVIGGHAGITILPLYSQVEGMNVTEEEMEALILRTQFGGDEVVQAKAGAGSATLSMAYAGFIFAENVVKAMKGEHNVVQCAFVESDLTDAQYFASPCRFGVNGVEEVLGYGEITASEQAKLSKLLPELENQITKGVNFVNK